MAIKVNIHEAKTQLSRLIKRAHEGEEIVLAKAGKPYARLVPLEKDEPRRPGLVSGYLDDSFFEPLSDEELASWGQ